MDMTIIRLANTIFFFLILLATIIFSYRFKYIALGFKKFDSYPKASVQKRFCVLIAARNESKVITRLLKSLKEQNYNPGKFDVYVIVEDPNDKTVSITKSFDYIPFVRKDLTKAGKGYALDECIQEIFTNNKDYDILTIVDADNVLAPNYLEEFNNAFCYGYPVGHAYHRQYNEEGNWLADCSTLTFAGMNTFQNKARTILGRNIIMSGSGLYMDFNIIKDLKGWTFTTLTEDYEFSMYCAIHNIRTAYIPTTYYYDEQPTTLSQSRKQRVRWIKGYMTAQKMYSKQLKKDMFKNSSNINSKLDFTIGVVPNILYVIGLLGYELFNIIATIYFAITQNTLYATTFKNFLGITLIVYAVLQMYTILQLSAEREHLKFSFKNKVKIALMNPIYICLYVPFAIEAILKKNVTWVPIKHGEAVASAQTQELKPTIQKGEPTIQEDEMDEGVTLND